ncbi:MAG: sodium-dependent transporter [Alphaproteobacteria bacterium]
MAAPSHNPNNDPASGSHRDEWGSRFGFILATIGSAAGIGNIWRFSYVAGENGGGAFLLVYFIAVILVGLPLVLAELAVGRATHRDAVGAYAVLAPGTRWHLVGRIAVFAAFLILAYYAVVAGWALKYFVGSVDGSLWVSTSAGYGAFFESFIGRAYEPIFWQGAMVAVTVLVVMRGVRRGIEFANKILMPLLAVLVLALAVWGVFQPGAGEGLAFLFAPDWSALTRSDVYLAAMGQAFFSLGVGMSIFVTYGSYLAGKQPMGRAAGAIVVGDTAIAIFAGIAIFTTVFAFGHDPAAGPQLAFITLPQIFLAIPAGKFLGPLFFALLVAGAITSMVSILEVPVAFLVRRYSVSRRIVAPAVGFAMFLVGIPASLGFGLWADVNWQGRGILDTMDFVASNILLPLGGVAVAVFVGWRWLWRREVREAQIDGAWLYTIWLWLLRLVAPALILAIMIHAASTL